MRIPSEPNERGLFYRDILQQCLISREERKRMYNELKRYYMTGCSASDSPSDTVNKIYPHIDQLCSFMYSQETTKFGVEIPATVSDLELPKMPAINRAINDEWHDTNCDILFGNALTWAFVYGSMFLKFRWNGLYTEAFAVEPHNFGVLREDIPMLARQEAFAQIYLITRSELERELTLAQKPGVDEIMKKVSASGTPDRRHGTQVGNVIVSSVAPSIIGNVDITLSNIAHYEPRVQAPLIKMYELYVQSDKIGDYQIVTIADPDIVIYDRPLSQMFVENEQPFIQVCPTPAYDYFWGHSEVERLVTLQDLRNERLQDVRRMMKLQARPPKVLTGFTVSDEEALALDNPGASVVSDMPGAKAEKLSPEIPEDLFREIRELDAMFEEMSGINNVLSGRGEQGVRSAGHASQLAKLGASRAKKRALIIEDALEKQATLVLQMMQKFSKRRYKADSGETFILEQFTKDFSVKVDAHSNSPIFMEEADQRALMMLQAGAIDREEFIDLLTDVPMRQLLKYKLKTVIQPAEQAAREQENKLKLITGKSGGK